jgi:hypothetical protein
MMLSEFPSIELIHKRSTLKVATFNRFRALVEILFSGRFVLLDCTHFKPLCSVSLSLYTLINWRLVYLIALFQLRRILASFSLREVVYTKTSVGGRVRPSPDIYMDQPSISIKDLCQDGLSPGWDLNSEPPEYEHVLITLLLLLAYIISTLFLHENRQS